MQIVLTSDIAFSPRADVTLNIANVERCWHAGGRETKPSAMLAEINFYEGFVMHASVTLHIQIFCNFEKMKRTVLGYKRSGNDSNWNATQNFWKAFNCITA